MVNLIIAIISLVVIALIVVSSYDIISVEGRVKAEAEQRLNRDLEDMVVGIDAFLIDVRDMATGVPDVGDSGDDLTNILDLNYMYVPRAIQDGNWRAGVGEPNTMGCGERPSIWVCLAPPENGWRPGVRQAMQDLTDHRLAHGFASFASQCPDERQGGGSNENHWVFAVPVNQPGGGRPAVIASAPPPMTPVVYDLIRPVTVTYTLTASVFPNIRHQGAAGAMAEMQIREPGGAWVNVDLWRLEADAYYDRDIQMFLDNGDNSELNVIELIQANALAISKTGTIEAVVPPGWQVRWRTVVSSEGEAMITASSAQYERYMGQINPISL
jgi:hypothetical protein